MITSVTISNFKSIKKIKDVKLKPLTLFTGENSSGKSNIMEAISFFGQASRMKETTRRGQQFDYKNVFQGGDIKYPRTLENYIVFKKDAELTVDIKIDFKINKHESNKIKSIADGFTNNGFLPRYDNKSVPQTIGYSYAFIIDRTFYSQKIFLDNQKLIEVSQIDNQPKTLTYPENRQVDMLGHPSSILDEDTFMPIGGESKLVEALQKLIPEFFKILKEQTMKIYYISGERGKVPPETRVRDRQNHIPIWIGHHSQHLIEILSDCFTRHPEKSEKIVKWANNLQLNNIRAGFTVENILESNFRDNILKVNLNSNLAGLGSRQILSIITQIFYSEPNSVIMVEEPEISLHPKNQVLLHELFAEAILEGKQIICSTHSPFFVLALSKTIKNKLLNIDDIVVYEVQKDTRGTTANELSLNEHGFIEGGVPSFIKVESDLYQEWFNSLEEDFEE